MNISERLLQAAKLLEKEHLIADIGADHGELVIHLANNGYKKLIATDNKFGPFRRLEKNIANQGYSHLIKTFLTDGLVNLPDNLESCVILGMGGKTILHILQDSLNLSKKLKKIIICPQSEDSLVREFLRDNNFIITKEMYVEECNKQYPLIETNFVENYMDEQNYLTLHYGTLPLKNRDPLLLKRITKQYETMITFPLIVLKKEENLETLDALKYLIKNWYNKSICLEKEEGR